MAAAGALPPGPAPRAVRRRVLSQNFLVDPQVVEALVAGSGVAAGDLVLDIGAGNGLITAALAGRGATVLAAERDPVLAARLRARFAGNPAVTVAEADVLAMPLPDRPFSVVANIPFGITTAILRRLLGEPAGPASGLRRADLIVQAEVARKRGTPGRGTLLGACWEPWFEFRAGPAVPRSAFRPQPRVAAAVLIIRRRDVPLLDPSLRPAYARFVSRAFTGARPDVASALAAAVPRARLGILAAELGFPAAARPSQLSVAHWVGLFAATRQPGGPPAPGPRGSSRTGRTAWSGRRPRRSAGRAPGRPPAPGR
jgi:23S rRNA (adenine-N6)-dimethyltransferase